MTTIIQISDFHIKLSMGKPEDNIVFTEMVKTFEQFKHDDGKIIIVFNGDVIDNTNIFVKIKKQHKHDTNEKKAEYWEKKAEEEYTLATDYFRYLLDKLSIPVENLIFCCGNHDVNSWYDEIESEIQCPCNKAPKYSEKRFKQYVSFLDNLHYPTERKSHTYSATIDGFHFLVINSNWLNKYQYPSSLCINCTEVSNIIKSQKSVYKENYNNNKYKNIFVAHAPFSDYCEEAKYAYEKNKYSPITDLIDEFFGLQLFGDKHTGHIKGAEHIVGAPLDSDRITCVAHQFTDDDAYIYRTLTYTKDKSWEINETEKYIKDILDISEHYIKERAKEYLFDSDCPGTLYALNHFELVRASSKWSALNMLFKTTTKIKKPNEVGSGMPVPVSLNFINTVTRLVESSEKRSSISVRGGSRLGKSVCMSVLYLNMLHRFSCGSFGFIPVYINLEKIYQDINKEKPKESRDTKAYCDEVVTIVSGVLRAIRNKCESYRYDACCIIDGLNQYCFYRNAKIDNEILKLLNQKENECFKRIILCIDTDNKSTKQMEFTEPHQKKDAQYVIYFDPIKTYKVHAKERYEGFIKAYCGLNSLAGKMAEKTTKIIQDNIRRMGILELDANIMTHYWNQLINEKCKEDYFSLLRDYVLSKIPDIKEEIQRANYMLTVEGRYYSEIKKCCPIDNSTFDIIRTQPSITKYLLAMYYIETITGYDSDINTAKSTIPIKSCLNQLLDHEICTLVRKYIVANNLSNTILEFAEKYYDSLLSAGQATLTYLVGRLSFNQNETARILSRQEEALKSQIKENGFANDIYQRVANRSITLSRIFSNTNDRDMQRAVSDYVFKLISNENERKVNRRFHLQFYGDRTNEESSMTSDKITEGFDIYCTYHILCQRMKEESGERARKRLLSLELFTLCDLIQIRIDNPIAFTSEGNEIDSFFYNTKYNMPNDSMAHGVIIHMKSLINDYLEQFGNNSTDLFVEYLNHQNQTYDRILPILEAGPLEKKKHCYKPEAILEELIKLESTKRMGWLFPDLYKKIPEGSFIKARDSKICLETTLQHTYEMYMIGLLYLPNESDHSDYDKRLVLDIALIHDLGEAHTGDSIKVYEKHEDIKNDEKAWCRNLYLQGVHEGIADLTEYGKLWDQWSDNAQPTYNVKVAKDLDRLQLLYKLLQLVTENVKFSKNRFLDFWSLRLDIQTNEVIHIFNIIIAGNPTFVRIAKEKYNTKIVTLQERI